ncbi:MAG: peptide deformylase [Candidatus Shikimatogenerans sp. JK-2022]|nr:peptide deformylase [Candidatus Shikimatogenerans bostrichidophilus]
MIYSILLYNKKNKFILRKKSKTIKKNTNLKQIINNMFKTMKFYNGIGLAAPQIGKNIKLFIIKIKKKKKIFINPKIIKYYKKEIINKEGCLSFPNFFLNIKRKKTIYIKYYNELWEKKEKKINNLLSIVFQHEYDHLKGKLIIDY